jgi:GT2 family glycosyltransferase
MIYIVLLNYNGTADTIACLESLASLTTPDVRHIVVDNASKSGAIETLEKWAYGTDYELLTAEQSAALEYPRHHMTLITSPENVGYAAGNNIGIRLALKDPACEMVWLLNNDTVVAPDALDQLKARCTETPRIGICGSTLLYYDDRRTTQACGGAFNGMIGRPRQLGALLDIDNLPDRATIEAELDYVVGASMLVTRRLLETIGLLGEQYFLYCEEVDWATRAKGQFDLGWAPGSFVYHKEGASIGTSARSRPSETSIYYMNNSTLRFMRAYYPMTTPLALARIIAIGLRFVLKRDRRAAQAVALAILDFCRGRRRRGPLQTYP